MGKLNACVVFVVLLFCIPMLFYWFCLGHGNYFAVSAARASNYCIKDENGSKHIFVCKVPFGHRPCKGFQVDYSAVLAAGSRGGIYQRQSNFAPATSQAFNKQLL